nr:fimbria/pilus periplasmic chaperone [Erwinia tasmaniensis]
MNDRWMTTVIATWIMVPAILLSVTDRVRATGMVPQTSVLIVDEHDEEASMTLTNTDTQPALLVTSVEGIGQDSERLLLVSPPVVRVEAGKNSGSDPC